MAAFLAYAGTLRLTVTAEAIPAGRGLTAESRTPWHRYVVPVMLAIAGAVAFGFMRPDQILQANTATGGDMGAHIVLAAEVRDALLPEGRILGWSNDWYAGYPVLYFYVPLPILTTILLDVFLPYGVAFKLVTVAGLVALPFAAYYLARSLRLSRPVALVAGIAGGSFVFMESFSILGGNTLSTLAGEYTSFALSLVYLGMVIRNTEEGRGLTPGAGIVLALTAMSHLITTLLVVLASLPLLLKRKGPAAVVGSWGLGFLLAGFWAVPVLARVGLTTDMRWVPVEGWDTVFPREIWPMLVLAAGGVAWAVVKRLPLAAPMALAVVSVAGYFVIEYIDYRKIYNARTLPYWYFLVFFFAGIGAGVAVQAFVRRIRSGDAVRWVAAIGVSAVFLIGATLGISRAPAWARWNYSGYEGKAAYAIGADGQRVVETDYWGEYMGLMETLDTLPPGRVMWEYSRDQNRYGTPMALMLTGYWTEGHPSMEGLLFESSLTTPFHFLNQSELSPAPSRAVQGLQYSGFDIDRGIRHLQLYGVDYYVTFTERARDAAFGAQMEHLAETPPFDVFKVPDVTLVDVAAFEPAVWDGEAAFFDAALEWYNDMDVLDRWIVADGPDEWLTVDDPTYRARRPVETTGVVSEVVIENHRIEFTTTAVGVPHMVKVSYFPNWSASGAEGPYQAAPSLMVVVPTEEHVVISFENTWAENIGLLFTVTGLFIVAGLVWVDRRRRQEIGS